MRLSDLPKKMKATLTAAAVGIGVLIYSLTNSAAPPPSERADAQPPAIVMMAQGMDSTDEERRTAPARGRSAAASVARWALRVLVLSPLSLLGRGALALGKAAAAAAGTALSPVTAFLLGRFLSAFGVLTALFALLWRALNPDGKWRDFFRLKTLGLLALGALAVALAQQAAEENLASWPYLAQGLETFVIATAVLLCWYAVFRRTGRFARQLRRVFFCPAGLACFALLFCGTIWLGFARVKSLAAGAGVFWGVACADVLRLWLVAGAVLAAAGLSMKVRTKNKAGKAEENAA